MRKRVLLASPNSETFPSPVYPIALPRLAGVLISSGHEVAQFDVLVHDMEALEGMLKSFSPDVVALSIRNIDNVDAEHTRSYLPDYINFVTAVRNIMPVPIVLGGSGFSIFPEELMDRLEANYGVVGPGEEALCHILNELDGSKNERNENRLLCYSSADGRGNADFTTTPLHQPELVEFYWRRGGIIGIQTKRGCVKRCSYCTYPSIDGINMHFASVLEVVDEIELLYRQMGISYFFFVDSVFNQKSEHELALAEEIIRRRLPIRWGAFFSPCGMERMYLETLKKSGLTHVEFGTEALSDTVLRSYNKGFTIEEVQEVSKVAVDLRLYTAHYLLFGGPDETPETVRETMLNATKFKGCVFFPFVGVRIYPGTKLFARALNDELVLGEKQCFDPVFYFPERLAGKAIWDIVREESQGKPEWVLPSRFAAMAPAMRRLRMRGAKGPLWEHLIRN
jgi:radical SAM superfamily enzyme YgiQ (UPF0313 family)